MKHTIEIRNGSGWNNYPGLKALKNLPSGTKGLMKKNGVAEIRIGPADDERPFGVAARYYDAQGELVWEQSFGEDSSASWIRERVASLLEETISVRREKVRAERAAKALEKANAAGFATAKEHGDHLAAMAAAMAAAKRAEDEKNLAFLNGENGGKEAAAAALENMKELRAACPEANGMTRAGRLGTIKAGGHAGLDGWEKIHDLTFSDRIGMQAWLKQNGHRPSVDDRQFFFDAAEPNASDQATARK